MEIYFLPDQQKRARKIRETQPADLEGIVLERQRHQRPRGRRKGRERQHWRDVPTTNRGALQRDQHDLAEGIANRDSGESQCESGARRCGKTGFGVEVIRAELILASWGDHKGLPLQNQFFVGATFMVALARTSNGSDTTTLLKTWAISNHCLLELHDPDFSLETGIP